jgi:chromosome segregation ATPase
MKVLLVILTGAEIGVWAALLFTIGFALHFWWTQRQFVKQDPSQKEKLLREETARWKNRFLQETGTLSRELDRLRLEAETAADRCSSLESALSSKEELLNHLKHEHRIYRELLTSSLRSGEPLEKKLEQVVAVSAPTLPAEDPLHLDKEQGRTLHADLHRAEVRIEELELKLMDREDEIQRLQATEGGSGDLNDELLEKISKLELQLIHARSIAEALEQANTRIRELEEQLEQSERYRESLNNSHHRLTEENQEQYNHFKTQMNELVAARQRLAHLDSQAEEPPRG